MTQMPLFTPEGGGLKLTSPVIAQLSQAVAPMFDSVICLEVLDRFLGDAELMAIPIVDTRQRPVALLDRHQFVEFLSRLYSRELFGRRSLRKLLKELNSGFQLKTPVIVEASTTIDDVAQIIIGEGMQHMVSGFITTNEGEYLGVVSGHALLNEITLRKQADMYHLAHFDSLTQLPNRMLFTDRLAQACRDAERHGTALGLMFLDVDRFKQVNDSLGHQIGDLLLQGLTKRLLVCVRDCDTLARLGGDEFAVLMDGLSAPEDADVLARRLVEVVQKPFFIHGREINVSLSVGIALYPRDDTDMGVLLSKADAAMYEVKLKGRNNFAHYTPGLATYSTERMGMEVDLRHALESEEFFLLYQPQVNLKTGEMEGVEALIRWNHPSRGVLTPASFIHVAEESGLIVPMGDWVLEAACAQQRIWQLKGMPPVRMAVNISALQFAQPDFVENVKRLMHNTCVGAEYLELELTESMVMCSSPEVMQRLEELKSLGVQLSLDDFGTGFSSLSYLQRFPIHRLKIDQSFMRGIDQNPVNASIVRAMVGLARSLSMQVVAEGVETEAELEAAIDSGCDESQGYLHARPMSGEQVEAWFQAGDFHARVRPT